MKGFDGLRKFIFGNSERQNFNTPTGYGVRTVQTDPNIIQRAGTGFKSLMQGIKEKFDPNTIAGFNPEPSVQPSAQPVVPTKAPVMPTSEPTLQDRAMNMKLDYTPYVADPDRVDAKFPQGIPQPSFDQLLRILKTSPEDATRSAILKLGETGGFNDYPADYTGNANGTIDRGANMINSGTFEDMWNKQGNDPTTYPHRERMQNRGINSFEDMKDPDKNELMMELIRRIQGYGKYDKTGGGWYGPADSGFNIYDGLK